MSSLIHFFAAFIIPIFALRFIVSWKQIKENIIFILISILSCTIPYLIVAQFNYEFPALVGGAIGLFISVIVANKGIGLAKTENSSEQKDNVSIKELIKALLQLLY